MDDTTIIKYYFKKTQTDDSLNDMNHNIEFDCDRLVTT